MPSRSTPNRQLRDLRKKTLRGQIGQKERGFCVGERTFGYRSVPVGTLRMDKKGRPRPDGYKMVIEPREAAIVQRIFRDFATGNALTHILKDLNREGVVGQIRSAKGWSPATLTRMLRNEKYVGRWVWNRTETRRDPTTGRRRKFAKPESAWIVQENDSLRIVPQGLWEQVQRRLEEIRKTWPGQKGKRGFETQRGGWVAQYPSHLLAGTMVCNRCGKAIAQVSGKSGGYYGCLSAAKSGCDNRLLVRRTLAERVILSELRDKLLSTDNLEYVLQRVEREVAGLTADVPEALRLKKGELAAEERKIGNFIEFIGEGRGSRALAGALTNAEARAEHLRGEIEILEHSQANIFRKPPRVWIEERVARVQEVLERKTARSALLLRKVLGPIRLEPTTGEIGRAYYRAHSTLDVLALLDAASESDDPEPGSNSLRKWAGKSNHRYKSLILRTLG